MDTFIALIRWLAFIPGAVAAYVVGTWAVFFGISYGIPEIAHSIRYAPDFAGHVFYGPAVVFTWFSVATAAAVFAGISIAPSHRRIAAGILGVILVAFIGFAIFGFVVATDQQPPTWQMIFRTVTELVGMLCGLVAGIGLGIENGSFRSDSNISLH